VATSRIADAVGRVLGDRYRLTRPLGWGASAAVYAAEDGRLRRRVAVKVLHPGLAADAAFLRRFAREAQAVASLVHPHVLQVYDWGDEGGSPWLVMELLEGGTLRSMLDRGALLSAAQAATVGAGAASALAHAHHRGLVHRDVKPANLLFDREGRVRVADFGLARALAEASWTEPNGAVVGTARYASPELVRGEGLDEKSDVYSLALVLVEALTGSVPFAADTAMGSLMARLAGPIEPPEETGPLAPVLAAAGTLDADSRLDAATFARRLEEVAGRLPFPAPLSLAGPAEGVPEFDAASPTLLPGRPVLFDGEAEPAGGRPGAGDERSGDPEGEARSAPPGTEAPGGVIVAGHPGRGEEGEPGPERSEDAPAPRRRRRRWLAGVLAVLLAGAAAVGGLLWATRPAPLEPVPAVVGLTAAQATTAVARVHLRLDVTASTYDPRPAGQIVSQSPAGGRLRRGQALVVVVSRGPAPVNVPAVANDALPAAEQVLAALGLHWTIEQATSLTVPAGSVIASHPDRGTLLPGQSVTLVVSTGKPQVPVPAIALGSEQAAAAEGALTQAGLAATVTLAYSNTVPKGAVISAQPAPGARVAVGTSVTLTVSEGPHYVTVPPTANDSVGAASEALSADGFDVTGVVGNPLGTVTGTVPAAGTQAIYGSEIEIYAS
jgi:beta-lactam-binding protein with PASTA domain/tRNA A-37 threonylcarbamoyl transferase component Bud32